MSVPTPPPKEKKRRKRHVFGRRKVTIDANQFTVEMKAAVVVVRHHRHRRKYTIPLERLVPLILTHAPLQQT